MSAWQRGSASYADFELIHFLLVYDREEDVLVSREEFRDSNVATAAHEAAEQEAFLSGRRIDIALVGSDSLDTMRVTHSNNSSGNAVRGVEEALRIRPCLAACI